MGSIASSGGSITGFMTPMRATIPPPEQANESLRDVDKPDLPRLEGVTNRGDGPGLIALVTILYLFAHFTSGRKRAWLLANAYMAHIISDGEFVKRVSVVVPFSDRLIALAQVVHSE